MDNYNQSNNYSSGNYNGSGENNFNNSNSYLNQTEYSYSSNGNDSQGYGQSSSIFGDNDETIEIKFTKGLEALSSLTAEGIVRKAFLYMFIGLLITALVAVNSAEAMLSILITSPSTIYLVFIAEIAVVLIANVAKKKNNVPLTASLFIAYSVMTGFTFSILGYLYSAKSIGAALITTAAMFGTLSVYGLVTKKDVSRLGTVCYSALLALLVSSLVQLLFLRSTMADVALSAIGIVIFAGITLYDANKIKAYAEVYNNTDSEEVVALSCAFDLYLDFINVFLKLLRLMGKKK